MIVFVIVLFKEEPSNWDWFGDLPLLQLREKGPVETLITEKTYFQAKNRVNALLVAELAQPAASSHCSK
jgi:hypothetical protein